MGWMVCNRLDPAHAISVVSRFIADLGHVHGEVDI